MTGCEEQAAAFAARLNGDPTADALAGELIVMAALDCAEDELDEEVVGVVGVAGAEGSVGAEGDGVGTVAAAVTLEAAPPHPVATTTDTVNKDRARPLCFKRVTSFLPSCRFLADHIPPLLCGKCIECFQSVLAADLDLLAASSVRGN